MGDPDGDHLWHGVDSDGIGCDGVGGRVAGLQPGSGGGAQRGRWPDVKVTLTPTDTTDYTNATATVSINVNQATPTITWATPADITYGTALTLRS